MLYYILFISFLIIYSCDKADSHIFIAGCTYSSACNYNENAEVNDDSCLYNDCFGVCGGEAVFDECDICDGNNSSCSDCEGIPNGEAYLDCCGNCDMNDQNNCVIDEYDICNYDVELLICEIEYAGLDEVIFTVCAQSLTYNIITTNLCFL